MVGTGMALALEGEFVDGEAFEGLAAEVGAGGGADFFYLSFEIIG